MGYGFKVDIQGDYALFSRPELKVERYSYDVITPSAARGILESICWKPAIRYVIDKIQVINKISETNIRRNEVSSKISANTVRTAMKSNGKLLCIDTSSDIQQRASRVLKNVHYIIEAHFEMTDLSGESDSEEKFYNMILRRLRNGQCFHQPYLGCREFPAKVSLCESSKTDSYYQGQTKDLGIMLYDIDFTNRDEIKPQFFHAVMVDGVINLEDCEVLR